VLAILSASTVGAESRPLRQVIDSEIQATWKKHKVTAVGLADDATFLRRLHLDLVGTIPTAEEAQAFLADTDASKRSKLIERLLADPRFATHQADVWDLAMFGRNPPNGDATRKRDSFKSWLAGRIAKDEPYDRWVKDILLAEQPGSELFLVQFRSNPESAAEGVSRIFLGTQLQCARCHDHPYENWTQREFYGMAGFFVRLVVVDGGGARGARRFTIAEKSTGDVLFSGSAKEQRPGRRGDPVKPKFLGGAELWSRRCPRASRSRPSARPNPCPNPPSRARRNWPRG